MSSEMRELVQPVLAFVSRQPCRCMSIAQLGERDYCDRCQSTKNLRTLLARTEAGADGAVEWLVRCRRTGRVIWSDPSRSTADGYARQVAHRMPDNTLDTEVIPLHTHPQDASGDAVDWKWQYRFQTVMRFMDNGATREAAERAALIDIAELENAAMQAKEAK